MVASEQQRVKAIRWASLCVMAAAACYSGASGSDPVGVGSTSGAASAGGDDGPNAASSDSLGGSEGASGGDDGVPGNHGEGDATLPGGRRVRRMTADQFNLSLITATGQAWPQFADYAAAMGQADYAQITEEGRELSVTFDKFIHDAATYSCNAAIEADVAGTSTGVLLRHATIADRAPATLRLNLNYLMIRMLGQSMAADDPRVQPWLDLLLAPTKAATITDALMQERWTAVCIGLVTHPDFFTY